MLPSKKPLPDLSSHYLTPFQGQPPKDCIQKDIPGMFFLHGHFLRINGLIDADSLQKQDGGREGDEINKPLRAAETLPASHPFFLLPLLQ